MDLINFLIQEDLLVEYVEGFINGFTKKPDFYPVSSPIAFQYPHNAFYWEDSPLGQAGWANVDYRFRKLCPDSWYTLNINHN